MIPLVSADPSVQASNRYGLRREKLVVLYHWQGGQDEDPVIVAVIGARRDLTTRSVTAYFRRKTCRLRRSAEATAPLRATENSRAWEWRTVPDE